MIDYYSCGATFDTFCYYHRDLKTISKFTAEHTETAEIKNEIGIILRELCALGGYSPGTSDHTGGASGAGCSAVCTGVSLSVYRHPSVIRESFTNCEKSARSSVSYTTTNS